MRCCRLPWVAVEKDFFVAELECGVALVALDVGDARWVRMTTSRGVMLIDRFWRGV